MNSPSSSSIHSSHLTLPNSTCSSLHEKYHTQHNNDHHDDDDEEEKEATDSISILKKHCRDDEDADSMQPLLGLTSTPVHTRASTREDLELNCTQRHHRHSCWSRKQHCCGHTCRLGPCCLLSTLVSLLTFIAIAFPLFYYLLMPHILRMSIETAPAPTFRKLDIQRIWAHNESITADIDAYFDVKAPVDSRFNAATFKLGIVLPYDTKIMHVCLADFGQMVGKANEPVYLKFRGVLHDFKKSTLHSNLATLFQYVESSLSSDKDTDSPPIDKSIGDPYIKLVLSGTFIAHLLGLNFPPTQFHYILPLNLDLKDFFQGLDAQPLPDDDDNVEGSISASIRNPAFIGFNFGSVNMTVMSPAYSTPSHRDEKLASIEFNPLYFPYLNMSRNDERAIISAKLDFNGFPTSKNNGTAIQVRGSDMKMLGYGPKMGPVTWFEELFHGLEINVNNLRIPSF